MREPSFDKIFTYYMEPVTSAIELTFGSVIAYEFAISLEKDVTIDVFLENL